MIKPISLTQVSSTPDASGHTCTPGSGTSNCSQSYYTDSGGVGYTSYVRTIIYSVNGSVGGTIGLNMQLEESFNIPNVITGGGVGSGITDCFYFCSQTCRTGGSDSQSGTQTIKANGFTVATKSVTWNCTDASVT